MASCTPRYIATDAIRTIHASPVLMLSLASPITSLSWITIVPLLPITWSTTPFQARRPAKVTTNDGTPIRDTKNPWNKPIATPVLIAAVSASQVGHWPLPGSSSTAATTPPMPLT